jgi:CubicO group peptidase (beta-lactamase class C family)
MMRLHTGALVLTTALLLAACGDDDGGASATGPTTPEFDFSAFDEEVEAFIDERGLEGVGAILVHRDFGVIHQRGYGAFSEDRIYLIASSTKMVTAGVLMRLADQGLLDMDEPIADLVGWGDGNPTITTAQLLSNSSGLVGLAPNPAYGPYLCQYLYTGTLLDCAQRIFTTEQDDADVVPPDTEYRYGGGQWQVAGGVAEAVSGMSWADLIRETYSEPCELETFGYNNHFTQPNAAGGNAFNYPGGFDSDPNNLLPTDNPNMEGGAYTTISDYGKLLLMHLRGGLCGDHRVLSEEAVRRMRVDRVGEVYQGSASYGFGWWVDPNVDSLVSDPGAYGAFPWIDGNRDYGGFLVVEANSGIGAQLFGRVYPIVNEVLDTTE